MNDFEYYVPEQNAPFRIKRKTTDKDKKGFILLRWLLRLYPEGGHWIWHSLFYSLQILMAIILLVPDLLIMVLSVAVRYTAAAAWELVKAVLFPTLRTSLKLALFVALAIIVFYRFETIKQTVLTLFDLWLKK